MAMLGARGHYAVPRILHEKGLLKTFYTDAYVGNKKLLRRALNSLPGAMAPRIVRAWSSRDDAVLPAEKVHSFDLLGIWYASARKIATIRKSSPNRIFRKAAIGFSRRILSQDLDGCAAIWTCNGTAQELFAYAKLRGVYCIMEQTILPKRLMNRLLSEESSRWPGWQNDSATWKDDLEAYSREQNEWELADAIIAGSEFVREGLISLGVPNEKIHVIPYGIDSHRFGQEDAPRPARNGGPLRVLFAGEVGLRKGVPDLLSAFDRLPPGAIELRLAGNIAIDEKKLAPWRDRVSFLGPVPRSEMSKLYAWADVFILPSLVEGSATVTYEALMSGLPVIATANTGAIVSDGLNGFIVPIRAPEKISECLTRYIDDEDLLARHRIAAWEARDFVGLDRYSRDLLKFAELHLATISTSMNR